MFEKYKRTGTAEARPATEAECNGAIASSVSISEADTNNGSPMVGDMIARNPKNHEDQWLIAAKYFNDNFKKA